MTWDQVQSYLNENDAIAFSFELGDDLKESISDSEDQGEALIQVIGAFTKLMGMTARRETEVQLANTGDYQGYNYNRLDGSYSPRNGKWRTADPAVKVNNSKVISGSGNITVDGRKMGVNVYVPRLNADVGGYATSFDESDNISSFGQSSFKGGPGFTLLNNSVEIAFLTFNKLADKNTFKRVYYTNRAEALKKQMQRFRRGN